MIGILRKALGLIDVSEKNNIVTISGLNTRFVERDIKSIYETTKIAKYMFIDIKPSRVRFHSFFALEVKFILETMLENKSTRLNRRTIFQIIELLNQKTWLANTLSNYDDVLDINKTKSINFKLLEDQSKFIQYYNNVKPRFNLKGALYAGAPGSGKTIGAIATHLALGTENIYVICPPGVANDVWKNTLTDNLTPKQDIWSSADKVPITKPHKWMIFGYEDLDKAVAFASKYRLASTGIILDESHNMNSGTSNRSKLFDKLCDVSGSTNNIWCSGTAIKAMGSEAIPLFKSIIPDFTPEVEVAIKKIWGKTPGKANEILANRLGYVSYSIPKSKFMKDKPEEIQSKVVIPNGSRYTLESIRKVMSEFIKTRFEFYMKHKKEYQKIYDESLAIFYSTLKSKAEFDEFAKYKGIINTFVKHGYDNTTMADLSKFCNDYELKQIMPVLPQTLKKAFKDARSVVKYVDLKIKGECLGRVLGRERINCHVEMVKEIDFELWIENSLKKVLVFTDFVDVLKATDDRCKELGYNPCVVYGDTTKDIENILRKFRTDDEINPAIATFKSLAEGNPVTVANTGLLINQPFRWHHRMQAISRMHRIGQDEIVYVVSFILDTGNEPNISTRSEDIMAWSRDQVDSLMGIDRYGSNVNVDEVLGEGVESLDTVDDVISSGVEDFYNTLNDNDLITEDIPETPPSYRESSATIFGW